MGNITGNDGGRLGYRPGLDGLRAVAVLMVLAEHVGVGEGWHLTGTAGGTGVTAFFVLSGALITRLAFDEHRTTGTFSLGGFWVRRARRLLPALAFMVVAVWAAGATGRQALWALSYVGNFRLADGHLLGPLSHVWSLAVEEQFYVLWPLVLTASGVSRSRIVRWSAAAASTSFAVAGLLHAGGAGWARVYFGTDTRIGAVLVGCAIGALAPRMGRRAAWVGLAVLAVSCWPGLPLPVQLATATAGAGLAVGAGMSDGALGWLEWSPLVWIGQRSYGLYLWHYPLLWILHRHMGVHWVPVLAVAFLVTATSYRYVEQPIMRHRSHARKVQPQLALRSRAIGSTEWLA